ncbi:hypothetical protein Tcan_04871 [Toxocara canis]|uniref:Uncharacterized protein n=1 Tax=Toxocara canis TaxID=6265 RepID=A0A0B2VKP4_TOXCA|nr:hypothetical protein Tcan_04871 [Toxocara canis]
MGLASAITGFFRIWRQNGHQIKVDVRNAFIIDELLFRPNAKCSRGSDGGIIQIAVTQFLFKEYVWDEFDVIVDKGSPLFVDFDHYLADKGESVQALYVGDSFDPSGFDHYLADKGESVQALYVGDSFDPSGFGERPSVNKLLLVAAPTIINMFLHF